MNKSGNKCNFSSCKTWRYTLRHTWAQSSNEPELACVWIGLNPSTANERQLDSTLRRVRDFSKEWGFNTFYMLNLFAFSATKPRDLRKAAHPIGRNNNHWLRKITKKGKMVICAWGNHGLFRRRQHEVLEFLNGTELYHLGMTIKGAPRHPLYVKKGSIPKPLVF